MSEAIRKIFKKRIEGKEPRQQFFYSMIRRGIGYEVEKDQRKGYTDNFDEFGVFSTEKAFSNTKSLEGHGLLRFNIEKDLLDSIEGEFLRLEKENDELKQKIHVLSLELTASNKKLDTATKALALGESFPCDECSNRDCRLGNFTRRCGQIVGCFKQMQALKEIREQP